MSSGLPLPEDGGVEIGTGNALPVHQLGSLVSVVGVASDDAPTGEVVTHEPSDDEQQDSSEVGRDTNGTKQFANCNLTRRGNSISLCLH